MIEELKRKANFYRYLTYVIAFIGVVSILVFGRESFIPYVIIIIMIISWITGFVYKSKFEKEESLEFYRRKNALTTADELAKLEELLKQNIITQAEFDHQRAKLKQKYENDKYIKL